MEVLQRLFDALREQPELTYVPKRVYIVSHHVCYARAAVLHNLGIECSNELISKLLREEGLLPSREYGIPEWYANKWKIDGAGYKRRPKGYKAQESKNDKGRENAATN